MQFLFRQNKHQLHSMAILQIASQASQAGTLPALLISTCIKQANSKADLDIQFEDADALKSGKNVTVELLDNGKATQGLEDVIHKLCELYSVLRADQSPHHVWPAALPVNLNKLTIW